LKSVFEDVLNVSGVIGVSRFVLQGDEDWDVLSVSGVIGVGRFVLKGAFDAVHEECLQKGAEVVRIEHFGVVDLFRVGDFPQFSESESGTMTDVGEVAPSGGPETFPVPVENVLTVIGKEDVVWSGHVYASMGVAIKKLRWRWCRSLHTP